MHENNIQLRTDIEQYMTQQLNKHRLRVGQQLSEIRRENQELSTKVRSEAKEVINEEMKTFQTQVNEQLERKEQIIRHTREEDVRSKVQQTQTLT